MTHGDGGREKQQPVSFEKLSAVWEQDEQGIYWIIGNRGYIGKQLDGLSVLSCKTAGAKESFCMSTVGEDILDCFLFSGGNIR